jgi:hypothetical protein
VQANDAEGKRLVLAETTAVADSVVKLFAQLDRSIRIERELVADVIWVLRARPRTARSDGRHRSLDHVSFERRGLRLGYDKEGPGGTVDERARWIVTEATTARAGRARGADR